MSYVAWTRGSDFRVWADTLPARQKLPAVIRRLIHATVEKPKLVQFPADEGIQRRGWDGRVETLSGNAWVPAGLSVWEMGADQDPPEKAESDYTKRVENLGPLDPKEAAFVFVTPRKWEGKERWRQEKQIQGIWRDVFVWDCDDLEQWLEHAPAVDAWLARLLNKLPTGVMDVSTYWESLAATTTPPLTPQVFVAQRDAAADKLRNAISIPGCEIVIAALSPRELQDFACAVFAGAEEEQHDAFAARAIIVETLEALGQLTNCRSRLLLITNGRFSVEKHMVAQAVQAGHSVLTQSPYTYDRNSAVTRLPRAERYELQNALEAGGFATERAARLARESGGCLSVLVRLASRFTAGANPGWSDPQAGAPLLPLTLLGAWNDRNENDRGVVERFTGQNYANAQTSATYWLNQADGPLRFVGGIYSFLSREDSWLTLAHLFTRDLLERFDDIAREVVGEDDPRFDMPSDKRFFAAIHEKLPRYSAELREGIAETIALLGARGAGTPQGEPEGSSWRARRLVRQLLMDVDPRRWFSVSSFLPLLAEAAPDEFLDAIESDLRKAKPDSVTLFESGTTSALFSLSPHAGLMWALELLAWSSNFLSRVSLILAALAKFAHGGKVQPQPAGVLQEIFLPRLPQTAATWEERRDVLDLVVAREPVVAWDLLLKLLPVLQGMVMLNSKPRWRDWDVGWDPNVAEGEIHAQTEWVSQQLIELSAQDPRRWMELVNQLSKLPQSAYAKLIDCLRNVELATLSPEMRAKIWSALREMVVQHRFFCDAWWVLPKSKVDEIAEIEARFVPADPAIRYRWIFNGNNSYAFGAGEISDEDRKLCEMKARRQAVEELWAKGGLPAVCSFASSVAFPGDVGRTLAEEAIVSDWAQILPEKLSDANEGIRTFARGYAAARLAKERLSWSELFPLESWPDEAVAELAIVMTFERQTWEILRRRKPSAEEFFWQKVRPSYARLPDNDLVETVHAFLRYERPLQAIEVLNFAIHDGRKPDWDLVADSLDVLFVNVSKKEASQPWDQMSLWQITELVRYLQKAPTADAARVASLEWSLLPLTRGGRSIPKRFTPKFLHREIACNPAFFAELLSHHYHPCVETRGEEEVLETDEQENALCNAARDLVDSWILIPGMQADGSIDKNTLRSWVTDARKLCLAAKILERCDYKIGMILSLAPVDPDGSWPCAAVREALEKVPSEHIFRGFSNGVLEQRGMYTKSLSEGGEQERALAEKYRGHATKCKIRWPRTALLLRRIADFYDGQARREDEYGESRI